MAATIVRAGEACTGSFVADGLPPQSGDLGLGHVDGGVMGDVALDGDGERGVADDAAELALGFERPTADPGATGRAGPGAR